MIKMRFLIKYKIFALNFATYIYAKTAPADACHQRAFGCRKRQVHHCVVKAQWARNTARQWDKADNILATCIFHLKKVKVKNEIQNLIISDNFRFACLYIQKKIYLFEIISNFIILIQLSEEFKSMRLNQRKYSIYNIIII